MSERKIFVTSDLHFSHEAVLKYNNRPWKNVLEMNDALIENWNRKVNKRDTVIIVGDFAWERHGYFLNVLNGKKELVIGSHDKMPKKYLDCFSGVYMIKNFRYKNRDFVCIHCCPRVWEKSHYGSICLFGHCFDEKTEILTERGFLNIDEMKESDRPLTLNMENHLLEYNNINEIFRYTYNGKMTVFDNASCTIPVTPEHRMVGISGDDFFIEKANEFNKRAVKKIPLCGFSKGKEYEESESFFTLLGLIISEGHFKKEESTKDGYCAGNGIIIYQKEGSENFIRECLNSCNAEYTEIKRIIKDVPMIHFYLKAEYVKNNIYKYISEKNISKELMGLRGRKFRALLSGLVYGDGWFAYANNKSKKEETCKKLIDRYGKGYIIHYCTGNEKLKDVLQHLCCLNGMSTNSYFREHGTGKGVWYITVSNRRSMRFAKTHEDINYNGRTWCVSVPNGTVVARRNGFVFITGNSHGRLNTYNLSFDVGVDVPQNRYSPISMDEILERVSVREAQMERAGRIRIEEREKDGKKSNFKIFYQDDLAYFNPDLARVKIDMEGY